MKIFRYIWRWVNANRLRKVLSSILAILILLTSIRFIFLKPKVVYADSTLGFDEGYGTTVSDQNSKISGTITGATWKSEEFCKVGKCLYFDGSGDSINFGNDSDVDFTTGSFTLEGWFRTPDINAAKSIMEKYNPTTGTDGGYKVLLNSSGYLVFEIYNNNSGTPTDSVSTSTTVMDNNKWHHFAAVKNGTTSISLYVDGKLYQTDSAITASSLTNTDSLYMGVTGFGSGNDFSGFLDEIKIYSTAARSAAEINADFMGETTLRGVSASFGPDTLYLSNGLVGYWPMDEGAANTCTGGVNDSCDKSGNGKDGAWNGNTANTNGKYGSGTSYDGTGDFTSIAESDADGNLDFGSDDEFTVAFWLNPTSLPAGSTYDTYVGKNDGNNGWYAQIQGTGNMEFCIVNSGSQCYASSTTPITAGVWQYYVFTTKFGDDSTTKMFYNGSLVPGSWGSSFGLAPPLSNNALRIGGNGDSTEEATGKVDEVRIYNRLLTPVEIQNLYNWAPGPIGYWKMDENTGTSVIDYSGNGNNGTMSGTSLGANSWRPGKFGNALLFGGNGTDDQVSAGDPASGLFDFGATDSFSIAFWTKISPDVVQNQSPVSKGGAPGWRFRHQTTDQKMYFQIRDGTFSPNATTNSAVADDQWHHIEGVRDVASDTVKIYMDGVLQESATDTTTAGFENASNLIISDFADEVRGLLDDVKIYNYARTPAQVIEDMNGGHPTPGSPVGSAVGHWGFDEGTDNTCSGGTNDICNSGSDGNNLDGAETGMAIPATSTSGWTNSGKYGKAINFDGVNDNISIGDKTSLEFADGSSFSLSFWVKSPLTNTGTILAKKTSTGSTTSGYDIRLSSSNTLDVYFSDGTDQFQLTKSNAVTANAWTHVVVVYDDASTTNTDIYINGTKTNATQTGTLSNVNDVGVNTQPVKIGSEADDQDYFLGAIDDLQIFRSAMTADQIKELYNNSSMSVMGATSTDSSGNATWSDTDSYCPPGQGTTCTGPLGEWKFDEGTGTSINDTSGNGYNVTALNNINYNDNDGWKPGKQGWAFQLDGTDDSIQVANSAFSLVGSDFTVEAWVKLDSQNTSYSRILTYRQDASNGYHLAVVRNNDGTCPSRFLFEVDKAATYYAAGCSSSSVIASNNIWYHVVGTFTNATNTPLVYVNGVLQSGTTAASLGLGVTTTLTFGSQSTAGSNLLDGTIDLARVYNYVRTQPQVSWDYNHGGPVGWWEMDESSWTGDCSTSTVKDSTDNALDGKACPNASAPTITTSGKINNAGTFDGTNDYIDISNSKLPTGDFTVTLWFKSNTQGDRFLFHAPDTTGTNELALAMAQTTGTYHLFGYVNGTGYEGSIPISDATWYHAAITRSGSTIKTYVDSKLDVTTSDGTALSFGTCTSFFIGTDVDTNCTTRNQNWQGNIDDVRVYNYALTPQQIKNVMNDNSAVKFWQ